MVDEYYETPELWTASRFESRYERERFESAARLVPTDVTALLDVGCGNGAFLRVIEETRSLSSVGVEPAAAARAAAVCASEIVPGSAEQLPFTDGSFDLVAAMEVLEHLRHDVYLRALDELRRVAKKYVLITVPYREDQDQARCPGCGCAFHPHYHMRTFDDDMLDGLLHPMQVITREFLFVPDYIGGRVLRRAYRAMARPYAFPPTTMCPQCGLRGSESSAPSPSTAARGRGLFARAVRDRLPRVRRARWAIALYSRRS